MIPDPEHNLAAVLAPAFAHLVLRRIKFVVKEINILCLSPVIENTHM